MWVKLGVALIAGLAIVWSAYIGASGSSKYTSQQDACDKTLAKITEIISGSSLPADGKVTALLHAQNAYTCCESQLLYDSKKDKCKSAST